MHNSAAWQSLAHLAAAATHEATAECTPHARTACRKTADILFVHGQRVREQQPMHV